MGNNFSGGSRASAAAVQHERDAMDALPLPLKAAPLEAELLAQLVALQRAANGICALEVRDRNYLALMLAYRRERDATEALVERAQAAHGVPVVGSFPSRRATAAEGR